MELALKGVLSGGLIVGVLLLARAQKTQVAGLLVLFPVVTLVSYYFVGERDGRHQLRSVVRASLTAFPIWLLFMGVVYVALQYLDFRLALLLATIAWVAAAAAYLGLVRL